MVRRGARLGSVRGVRQRHPERRISRLVTVELRCLLARRRRAGVVDVDYETNAWATFTTHVAAGVFAVEPIPDARFNEARELIDALPDIPLRTLDALHLATARAMDAGTVATADIVMRTAAEVLGLKVEFFGTERR